MSITDCSLVGGADRSHPLPCPPVASVRSMDQRYPTIDDDDNAEGNASKRKQEDDLDDATMESTENDDADASEANTSASSNRCTVLRNESINKKTRTSCIVSTTELIATTSVGSTAMEVADVCPPVSTDCPAVSTYLLTFLLQWLLYCTTHTYNSMNSLVFVTTI